MAAILSRPQCVNECITGGQHEADMSSVSHEGAGLGGDMVSSRVTATGYDWIHIQVEIDWRQAEWQSYFDG